MVTKKLFDWFIMLIIVMSSIALASEDPVDEDSKRNKILGYADYGFTAIFTLECTLKVSNDVVQSVNKSRTFFLLR